jgi:hypothetical protein
MANLELSISPEYVNDWDLVSAVRELYQNALDQSTIDPNNELLFDYDVDTLCLSIGNRKSSLDVSTLVLGKTTKGQNENLIGQFGEGYKLALAVLLRLGKSVTIYNNPSVWTPTIKHSDQFNTPILNINIVKYRFKDCPEHDLIFRINGVTRNEFVKVFESNRNLHHSTEEAEISTSMGRILLGEQYKGQIFVSGLHIITIEKAHYGYDFKPNAINIGRDRNLVNEFSIFYKTAEMWAPQHEHVKLIEKLIADNAPDVTHIDSYVYKIPKETVRVIGGNWYGSNPNCIPCANQRDAARAKSIYGDTVKTIIVSEQLMCILKETEQYKTFTAKSIVKEAPYDLLKVDKAP